MEDTIKFEGFAYEGEGRKLFPLVAKNADGTVNAEETRWLIEEAARTFGQKSVSVPSDQIDNVLSQILGAAQSHGISVLPQ